MQRVGAIAEAGLHPALGGARHGEQRRHFFPRSLPCPAAVAPRAARPARAPPTRRRAASGRDRPPPMAPGGGGRAGVANGPAAGRAGSRRSRRTRLSASAMARSPSAIASYGGSAQSDGRRAGEGLRQAARTVADRGEAVLAVRPARATRDRAGEPRRGRGRASRRLRRWPCGRAGRRAPHRVRRRRGHRAGRARRWRRTAGRAGRPARRRTASYPGRATVPARSPAWAARRRAVGVGFVGGVLPGRAEQVRIVVDVAERAFSRHQCASPSHWYHWASLRVMRRFGRDRIRHFGGFRQPGRSCSRTRETGKKSSVR